MSLAVVVHWRVDLRDTGDYRPYNPTLYVRIVVPSPILHLSRLYGHDLTTRNPWFPGYRSGSDFGRIVDSVSHDSQSDKWSHVCPMTTAVIHGRYVVTHMVHVGCHGPHMVWSWSWPSHLGCRPTPGSMVWACRDGWPTECVIVQTCMHMMITQRVISVHYMCMMMS